MNRLPTLYSPALDAAELFDRFFGNGAGPFSRFGREMTQAFEHAAKAWGMESWGMDWPKWPAFDAIPEIDQAEDDKAITFKLNAPGMEAKDLDVEVADGRLTIRGSREEKSQGKGPGDKPQATQTATAESFSGTVALPSYTLAEKAEAKFEKGVLTVTVPKAPGKGPKKITVQPV